MLNITTKHDDCGIDIKTKPLKFLVNLFKRKKNLDGRAINEMDGSNQSVGVARIPSTLSVREILVSQYPASPLTTPARGRDIDTDMEALRISRHDNPFLKQVLASRESLVDSMEESESDDTNLMSQEYLSELESADPLSLPEVHEHMIRSPPPISWPRSPAFRVFSFPSQLDSSAALSVQDNPVCRSVSPASRSCLSPFARGDYTSSEEHQQQHQHQQETIRGGGLNSLLSPRLNLPSVSRPHQRSASDSRERNLSVLSSTTAPLRSLTDVRRLRSSDEEDSQQLVQRHQHH